MLHPSLRYRESVNVPPISGKVTIAKSRNIFTDLFIVECDINKLSDYTSHEVIDIYALVESTPCSPLFKSLALDTHWGEPNLLPLCLTQGQIVWFCNPKNQLLRQCAQTFHFLFTCDSDVHIASVGIRKKELVAIINRFATGADYLNGHYHRLVVLRQNT